MDEGLQKNGFLSLSFDDKMAASTNTFSDIDEMGSSRETSPLELLDELFKKSDQKMDERRNISPGLVKENRLLFEQKSRENLDQSFENSPNRVEKSAERSSQGNLKDIMQVEKSSIKQPIMRAGSGLRVADKPQTCANLSSPAQDPMVSSVTNSVSMSSSFTESQSVQEAGLTEKSSCTTTSKATHSPSSQCSEHDKDFLIDDDYKDQPQLTFYDQEDSIEESLFSTLDSLLAGKEKDAELKVPNDDVDGVVLVESSKIQAQGKSTGSPLRSFVANQNLRKFSLTNHIKEQLERTNEDIERSKLRSRADTLSSIASDDCILDYDCRTSEDEEELKIVEKQRSLSPRIREVSKHFEENSGKVYSTVGDDLSEYRCDRSVSRNSSITSDEGVIIDRSTHNTITQDTLEIKFLLLKLRRILQEADPSEGFVSSKLLDNFQGSDPDNSLREENTDLRRQVVLLKQQVEEKDRRLRHLELKDKTASPSKTNNNLKNAAIQTDRQRPMSCGSFTQDGLIRFDEY